MDIELIGVPIYDDTISSGTPLFCLADAKDLVISEASARSQELFSTGNIFSLTLDFQLFLCLKKIKTTEKLYLYLLKVKDSVISDHESFEVVGKNILRIKALNKLSFLFDDINCIELNRGLIEPIGMHIPKYHFGNSRNSTIGKNFWNLNTKTQAANFLGGNSILNSVFFLSIIKNAFDSFGGQLSISNKDNLFYRKKNGVVWVFYMTDQKQFEDIEINKGVLKCFIHKDVKFAPAKWNQTNSFFPDWNLFQIKHGESVKFSKIKTFDAYVEPQELITNHIELFDNENSNFLELVIPKVVNDELIIPLK